MPGVQSYVQGLRAACFPAVFRDIRMHACTSYTYSVEPLLMLILLLYILVCVPYSMMELLLLTLLLNVLVFVSCNMVELLPLILLLYTWYTGVCVIQYGGTLASVCVQGCTYIDKKWMPHYIRVRLSNTNPHRQGGGILKQVKTKCLKKVFRKFVYSSYRRSTPMVCFSLLFFLECGFVMYFCPAPLRYMYSGCIRIDI